MGHNVVEYAANEVWHVPVQKIYAIHHFVSMNRSDVCVLSAEGVMDIEMYKLVENVCLAAKIK